MLRALGIQLAATSDRAVNLAAAKALILQNPGHDLYVLPELSSTGYDDACFQRLEELAEDARDGPSAEFFREVARDADAHIAYGFPRRRTAEEQEQKAGPFAITQAVVAPSGAVVCTYDKMHLCNMGDCSETSFGFAPGADIATFVCAGVTVGLTICYDLRFPELYRRYAWPEAEGSEGGGGSEGSGGCDLILHPSAFVRDATFPTYHAFVTTRAQENGVYVLSVTYAGEKFGSSIAAPPWLGPVPGLADGTELAPTCLGDEEAVLPLVVEPRTLAAVRRAYPYRTDRNPTLVQPR